MPLEKVKRGNQTCYRWGSKGKVYCGAGAAKKALAQGYAEVDGDKTKFKEEMGKAGLLEDPLVQEFLESQEPKGSARLLTAIAVQLEESAVADDHFAVAYVSAEERKKIPLSNFADPKRRAFPINNQAHLDAATKLVGRESATKQVAIKSRIKEIASRLKLKLPDSWK